MCHKQSVCEDILVIYRNSDLGLHKVRMYRVLAIQQKHQLTKHSKHVTSGCTNEKTDRDFFPKK